MAQPEADNAVVRNRSAPSHLYHSLSPELSAIAARACILVLGMHRSGTSALTRVINLMGASLPRNLMPPLPDDNALGFWEPRDLWTLHDRMLAEAGSRWDDWRKLDLSALAPDRLEHYKQEILRQIADEFGNAPLIVLKEPRICRFVPLYSHLLAEFGYRCHCVLALRDPLAVIGSLGRRNRMSAGFAALLWLRHMLDAEAASRAMPRAVVSYDALLADWPSTVATLRARLGVEWPRAVDDVSDKVGRFLSKDLRHFAPSRRELPVSDQISAWVRDAYDALLRMENDPDDAAACQALDRVRAAFDAVADAFGEALFSELARREKDLTSEQGRWRDEAAQKEKVIQRLVPELEQRQRVIDDLVRECDERLRVCGERGELIQHLTEALRQRDELIANNGLAVAGTNGLRK